MVILFSIWFTILIVSILIVSIFAFTFYGLNISYLTHKDMIRSEAIKMGISYKDNCKFEDIKPKIDAYQWYGEREYPSSLFQVPNKDNFRNKHYEKLHASIYYVDGELWMMKNDREFKKVQKYIKELRQSDKVIIYPTHEKMWETLYTPLYMNLKNKTND